MIAVISTWIYPTPVGEMILGAYQGKLCIADWRYRKQRETIDKRLSQRLSCSFKALDASGDDAVIALAVQQLDEYFSATRKTFELPLLMPGTVFQQQVWQQLMTIPYGQTLSYTQLSQQLQNAKAVRAVAAANGANALSIIVPCHRIVGADGSLVGYAGGLAAKQKLLALEQGCDFGATPQALETLDLFDS